MKLSGAGGSRSRNLLGIITATCFAWSAPASAFSATWPDLGRGARAADRLLWRATVICARDKTGNSVKTWSCPDDYVCLPNHQCTPGPALQRELEQKRQREEAARRQAEQQRQRDIEQARKAEQERKQADTDRQAELERIMAGKPRNAPNPAGAGSANCSTITDRDHPGGGGPTNCGTSGSVNAPTRQPQHPNHRPQQAQAPAQQRPGGFALPNPGTPAGAGGPSSPSQQDATPHSRAFDQPMIKAALSPKDDDPTLDRILKSLDDLCKPDTQKGVLYRGQPEGGLRHPDQEFATSMADRINKVKSDLTTERRAPGKSLDLPLRNAEYFMVGLLGRAGGIGDLANVMGATDYDYAKDNPMTPMGWTIRLIQLLKGQGWSMQDNDNPNSPGGGFIWALAGYAIAKDVHPSDTTEAQCKSELANMTRDGLRKAVDDRRRDLRQQLSEDPDAWGADP